MISRFSLIVAIVAVGVWAQEPGAPAPAAAEHGAAEHGSGGPQEVSIWWKWANFAILAGALGYLISKNAPAFFAARNEEIRKGIEEGAALRREANERTAAMEARLKNLEVEIAELRTKAKSDIAAEGGRIQAETASAMSKIQAHAESEIAFAAKHERDRLKAFAADLALKLAEDKLRRQLTPESDAGLIKGFLKGLN